MVSKFSQFLFKANLLNTHPMCSDFNCIVKMKVCIYFKFSLTVRVLAQMLAWEKIGKKKDRKQQIIVCILELRPLISILSTHRYPQFALGSR